MKRLYTGLQENRIDITDFDAVTALVDDLREPPYDPEIAEKVSAIARELEGR